MAVVAAVVLGVVFLVASVTKLAQPAVWKAQASDLGVPTVVAAPVPFLEAAVGALLLVQFHRPIVAWVALVLLAAFTVLLGLRLAQGRRPPCACFGSLTPRPIGPTHLARNSAFILLALLAALA